MGGFIKPLFPEFSFVNLSLTFLNEPSDSPSSYKFSIRIQYNLTHCHGYVKVRVPFVMNSLTIQITST